MTIQSEINRINQGVQDVYTVLNDKKAVMPQTRNLANLVTAGETLPDFTLMGNELRKAYAYTHTDNFQGSIDTASEDFSSPLLASTINSAVVYNFPSLYIVIDNKLYIKSSNEAGKWILTQQGTATDWENVRQYYFLLLFIKNGYAYSSYSDAENDTNRGLDFSTFSFNQYNSRVLTTNGKIGWLKGHNSVVYLEDTSGVWTDFKDGMSDYIYGCGNRNGVFCALYCKDYMNYVSSSVTPEKIIQIYDSSISPDLYSIPWGSYKVNVYFASGKNLYEFSADTETYSLVHTFPSNIKKLLWKNYCLLEDDYVYSSSGYKIINEQIKDYVDIQDREGNGEVILLTKSNKLYKYNSGSLSLQKEFDLDINLIGSWARSPFIKYNAEKPVTTIMYKTEIENSYAYASINNSVSKVAIDSYSTNKITVNSIEYVKDSSMDSVFKFIPDELTTHTYSDQELCRAYLSAGIKPAGSNPVNNDLEETE